MHFIQHGRPWTTLWGFESRDLSEEGGGDDAFRKYLDDNGFGHVHDPHGVRSEMYYIPQPSQLPARLHHTAWVTDRSIDFLQRRDTSRPFFLMSSFIKPHPPFESPTPWNKLYRGPDMPLPKRPPDSEQLISYWNRFQNRYKYRDRGIDDNLIRQIKAAYYGAISFMDFHIGRLLEYMQRNGLLEDTLILFSSDHGEMLGDYDCFGKRNFLNSAARIPMLLAHPDLPGGKICDRPASLIDVMPTLLDYAGIGGYPCAGESLFSLASDASSRDTVFGQYHRDECAMYMAVTQGHKYIYSAPDQKAWLFDLRADPEETVNLSGSTGHAPIAAMLRGRLAAMLAADGITAPFENGDWKSSPMMGLPKGPDDCLLYQDPPDSLPNIPGYSREATPPLWPGKFGSLGF